MLSVFCLTLSEIFFDDLAYQLISLLRRKLFTFKLIYRIGDYTNKSVKYSLGAVTRKREDLK